MMMMFAIYNYIHTHGGPTAAVTYFKSQQLNPLG